jgi:formate hydrogenlyase subunit 3/multisubunit Na+/H+ antiporter MnhD subunit
MNLLLVLIFIPLIMAIPVYLLRRLWTVAVFTSLGTTLSLIVIWSQAPLGEPAYIMGRELVLGDLSRALLIFLLSLASLMILYTWRVPQGWAFSPSLLAILGLLSAAIMIRTFLIAVLLLEMAGLIFVFMVHGRRPAPLGAAIGYVVPLVIATPCLLMVSWLTESYALSPDSLLLIRFTVIALSLGFGILLAAAPFHSWLPSVAGGAPSMASATLICVLSPTVLALLLGVLNLHLWLITDSPLLSIIYLSGIFTALVGGVLAFAQRQPGWLLAYAAIADMGFVLVGLGTGSLTGVTGALAHLVNRSLLILLVAMSLGTLSVYLKEGTVSTLREALRHTPGSIIGYTVGGLALGGFPPFNGFATRWLIYRSLPGDDLIYQGALLLAGAGVVLGYVRSLTLMLRPSAEVPAEREPPLLTVMTLSLAALCLLLGLFPGLIVEPLLDIVQRMTFIGGG